MNQQKTKPSGISVPDYIEGLESSRRKEEAYTLVDIFSQLTQEDAQLWGNSIIGFGSYHYQYASGHSGDASLVGFSPRKAKISLYCWLDEPRRTELLSKLGKHSSGVGCIYVNKLEDIDLDVLRTIIKEALDTMRSRYPCDA